MRSADRVRKRLMLGVDRTYDGHHQADATDPKRAWRNTLLDRLWRSPRIQPRRSTPNATAPQMPLMKKSGSKKTTFSDARGAACRYRHHAPQRSQSPELLKRGSYIL